MLNCIDQAVVSQKDHRLVILKGVNRNNRYKIRFIATTYESMIWLTLTLVELQQLYRP